MKAILFDKDKKRVEVDIEDSKEELRVERLYEDKNYFVFFQKQFTDARGRIIYTETDRKLIREDI